MSERQTKEITTPIENHKVVIKSYLTGGEKISLSENETTGAASVYKSLEIALVSPSVEEVKSFHGKDFDFILNAVREVLTDSSWADEDKKKQ